MPPPPPALGSGSALSDFLGISVWDSPSWDHGGDSAGLHSFLGLWTGLHRSPSDNFRALSAQPPLPAAHSSQENLQELLANARIAALVDVVDLEDAQDLVAYSHDWTLRVTEAARFHKDYKEATDPKTPTLALPTSSGSRKWLSRDTFTPLQKGDRRQSIQRCESSQVWLPRLPARGREQRSGEKFARKANTKDETEFVTMKI